jgi:hypothetical protein
MRRPVFVRSSFTPQADAPGLFVCCAPEHRGRGGKAAVWVHGALVVENRDTDPRDLQDTWLRSLDVLVVAEANELPTMLPLTMDPALLQLHVARHRTVDGELVSLPFSFDLAALLGESLPDDSLWLRLSARDFCAGPMRIAFSREANSTGLVASHTEGAHHQAADALLRAYDAMAADRPESAVEAFSVALADSRLAADLDCPHLLSAARSASDATTRELRVDEVVSLRSLSIRWLEQHVRVFGEALVAVDRSLADHPDAVLKARLEAQRETLLQRLRPLVSQSDSRSVSFSTL